MKSEKNSLNSKKKVSKSLKTFLHNQDNLKDYKKFVTIGVKSYIKN